MKPSELFNKSFTDYMDFLENIDKFDKLFISKEQARKKFDKIFNFVRFSSYSKWNKQEILRKIDEVLK